MCAVVPILEVNVDESVSLVAVEKTHAFADCNQVAVEDGLKITQSSDVEPLVPSLVSPRSLCF